MTTKGPAGGHLPVLFPGKAAAMLLGTALPAAPLTAEAAETVPVNLALASNGASATANDTETNDYQASKAIDGIVNRDAPKPQSRWATNTSSAQAAKILPQYACFSFHPCM